jgi:hypothetical protein
VHVHSPQLITSFVWKEFWVFLEGPGVSWHGSPCIQA